MSPKPDAWTSIDDVHLLPSADQTAVEHLADSWEDADRLMVQLPARLQQMRADQEGQPRAAKTDDPPDANRGWCFTHDAPLLACIRANLGCQGELVTGDDATSAAAMSPDPAAADYRQAMRLVHRLTIDLNALVDIAAKHPIHAEKPDVLVECPEDWCVACFIDSGYHEPVTLDSKGNPLYARRCRWCGVFHSREGFDPPRWLLNKRHRGDKITETMIAKARAEWKATQPKRKKGKKQAAA